MGGYDDSLLAALWVVATNFYFQFYGWMITTTLLTAICSYHESLLASLWVGGHDTLLASLWVGGYDTLLASLWVGGYDTLLSLLCVRRWLRRLSIDSSVGR